MARTWITDDKGNRCSVERWGGEEEAKKVLAYLTENNCSGCSDCYDCYDCSGCSDCSDCSGCSGCSDCSRCSDCSGCSRCSDCSDCSDCSRCSDCSDCSGEKHELPPIPVVENIHAAIYEAASQPKAFDMDAWHSPCGTTHCRAGWAIHLAGDAGYELEKQTSPVFAAMQIYKASGYEISPCRFFDNNEKASNDMRQLAEPK